MFRVHALGGEIVDAILDKRGDGLAHDFFSRIGIGHDRGAYQLQNQDGSRRFTIDVENIVLMFDAYETDDVLTTTADLLGAFELIWNAVERILKPQSIRRIGIVGEFRFASSKPNDDLWKLIFKLPRPKFPAKVNVAFEERRPTIDALAPDIDKWDYINVIRNYYDSVLDADHAEEGALNANLDFQRYFEPRLRGRVIDEAKKLAKQFEREVETFLEPIRAAGIDTDG